MTWRLSGRVLDGEPGRARVRVQAARGSQVPQRRPLYGGRREVQLPALSRRVGQTPARPREGCGHHRSPSHPLRPARAVARLPGVLRHPRDGRGVDRAHEVHREGWRGRIQAPAGGARALSLLAHDSRRELVLEANEQYWRKKPSIKRVVIKGVPDRTTRLAMLKTGEADLGYLMVGLEAATITTDPKLRLAKVIAPATWWMEYPEQWNPKSPWSDRRVRLAAALAVDT